MLHVREREGCPSPVVLYVVSDVVSLKVNSIRKLIMMS